MIFLHHPKPLVLTIASETKPQSIRSGRTQRSGDTRDGRDLVSKESPEEPSLRHLAGQPVRSEVYVSARKAKGKANFNNTISHSPPPHTHTHAPLPRTLAFPGTSGGEKHLQLLSVMLLGKLLCGD